MATPVEPAAVTAAQAAVDEARRNTALAEAAHQEAVARHRLLMAQAEQHLAEVRAAHEPAVETSVVEPLRPPPAEPADDDTESAEETQP